MISTLRTGIAACVLGFASLTAAAAFAASEEPTPPKQNWSFQGPLGTFDRAALQRGFQVYKEVCSACHAMNQLYYRNLAALGFSDAEIKAIAAEYTVTDGPNDQGEMFERPARPSDHFKAPFPNDKAAAASNNGAAPPDLSLIVKARHGGADHVFAVVTGYEPPPAGMQVPAGMNYNEYFPGHMIAMPPPLSEGAVTFADGTPATVPQMAHDVTTFLSWAAEPEMETRKRIGLKVLAFLLLMAGVLYAYKRKVWAAVH
jgi:ubiquinol-cytochrome c reductase cytochrome c1 subunit